MIQLKSIDYEKEYSFSSYFDSYRAMGFQQPDECTVRVAFSSSMEIAGARSVEKSDYQRYRIISEL